MGNSWKSTRLTLEMIKWEHSIFALPFALTVHGFGAVGCDGVQSPGGCAA
jgi:hypothetical protein